MKTRVLKVLGIALITVSLAVSFFAIPVSAADGDLYSATFTFPILAEDLTYFRWADYVGANLGLNNATWNSLYPPTAVRITQDQSVIYYWNWDSGRETDRAGACSIFIGRSQFGVNTYGASDTIWCEPFTFNVILDNEFSDASSVRISLRSVDSGNSIGKCVGYSDWLSISAINSPATDFASVFNITIPRTYIRIVNPGNYEGLSVHLDFQCSSMDSVLGLGSGSSALSIFYGVGSSPNYPTFTPPDTAIINEVTQLDNEVLSSSSIANLETDTVTLFDSIGYSLTIFRSGIKFASARLMAWFESPTSYLEWFRHFIQISLALGIAASLLGIAASIIGAATRGGGKKGG